MDISVAFISWLLLVMLYHAIKISKLLIYAKPDEYPENYKVKKPAPKVT